MSNMTIQGGATGTGTVTLLAPSTSTNRTLTLPDVTDTVAGIAATQTLTNKTLTTPNINSAQFATVTGTAPIYPCRAWVNFDGTGTVAILASGNCSSITDNGAGDYTINFATAMPDANYAFAGTTTQGTAGMVLGAASSSAGAAPTVKTASAIRLTTKSTGGTNADVKDACVSFFR